MFMFPDSIWVICTLCRRLLSGYAKKRPEKPSPLRSIAV
nr:MAG TPA: hypothetical protein [Caudoviricetes sp.]